jgi:hypothetical protein
MHNKWRIRSRWLKFTAASTFSVGMLCAGPAGAAPYVQAKAIQSAFDNLNVVITVCSGVVGCTPPTYAPRMKPQRR